MFFRRSSNAVRISTASFSSEIRNLVTDLQMKAAEVEDPDLRQRLASELTIAEQHYAEAIRCVHRSGQ